MRLAWSQEQLALRDAVRGLLTRCSGSAAVRAAMASEPGYDRALWSRLCGEIGVAGLAIPAEYGGAGAGPRETHVVLEELGRTLTPSPLLGSAVLAAQALLAAGDPGACRRLLPGIADGTRLAALAWVSPAGHWNPGDAACTATSGAAPDRTATGAGAPDRTATAGAAPDRTGGWTIDGEAHYVLDGDLADVLLVAARTGQGIGLFEVDPGQPGVARTHVATVDPTRRLATVRLAGAAGRPLGAGDASGALRRVRDVACAALSAEQVGAAARALELTVEYAKVRVQFGRPIGSFQALKHRMADLYVLVETARSASYAAAAAAADPAGPPAERALRAAVAKVYCSEALCRVAGEMIQLHGGIGITWEHDAHLYFKRAHGSAQLFGRPAEHVARLAPLVGLGPADQRSGMSPAAVSWNPQDR